MGRERSRPLRGDWDAVKEDVMMEVRLLHNPLAAHSMVQALEAKFGQNHELRAVLLGTGEARLVEHTKNDSYWGDGGKNDGVTGKNRLGELLMQLRRRLGAEQQQVDGSAAESATAVEKNLYARLEGTGAWTQLQPGLSILGRNSKVSVIKIVAASCSREQAVISWNQSEMPTLTVRGQTDVSFQDRGPPLTLKKGETTILNSYDKFYLHTHGGVPKTLIEVAAAATEPGAVVSSTVVKAAVPKRPPAALVQEEQKTKRQKLDIIEVAVVEAIEISSSDDDLTMAEAISQRAAKAVSEPPVSKKLDSMFKAATSAPVPAAVAGWKQVHPTLHVCNYGSVACSKMAGFDMDWTLIRTATDKTFPQYPTDYKLWHACVPGRVQALAASGYRIAIFTNQAGVASGKEKLHNITNKIDELQKIIGVPLVAVISTGKDGFRKPCTCGWEYVEDVVDGCGRLDRSQCLFIGDGAGRAKTKLTKKDFGDSDLKFALNLGVLFKTPDEFFLGNHSVKYEKENFPFDPRKLGLSPIPMPVFKMHPLEVVLLVASPGSGKSAASRNLFPNHVRVNQDILKNKKKCLQLCLDSLNAKKSVVIDNQNKLIKDREEYIRLAKAAGAFVTVVRFEVPKDFCIHLNNYRTLNTASAEHKPSKVPTMVIHSFFKDMREGQEPTLGEGIDEIVKLGLKHFNPEGSKVDLALIRSFM